MGQVAVLRKAMVQQQSFMKSTTTERKKGKQKRVREP